MRKIFSLAIMLLIATMAQAKSFKVGPASSSDVMDFASINDAMSSSNVSNGDTLWLDKNYNETSTVQNVTKSVVIIGTGYDTTQTTEGVVATVGTINLKCDNVVLLSTKCTYIYFYNSNCIVDRCYISYVVSQDAVANDNTVRSSYIAGYIHGYGTSPYTSINLYNNVLYSNNTYPIWYLTDSDIQYNTIIDYLGNTSYNVMTSINNTSIKNNIILRTSGSSYYNYVLSDYSGCSIDHNIFSNTSASYGSENKYNYGGSVSSLFTCEGSYSDYYTLSSASAAKGYATDGGEVGCHGGMFGNPAGGRPQYVPYFSSVVVGSKSTDGKLPVTVSVKIQNK